MLEYKVWKCISWFCNDERWDEHTNEWKIKIKWMSFDYLSMIMKLLAVKVDDIDKMI